MPVLIDNTEADTEAGMTEATGEAATILTGLKIAIDRELRAYPYPITACDTAFKLLAEQRDHCRVALGGLKGQDGLTVRDTSEALSALLATPLRLAAGQRASLEALSRSASRD